jgi:hypothetical protein
MDTSWICPFINKSLLRKICSIYCQTLNLKVKQTEYAFVEVKVCYNRIIWRFFKTMLLFLNKNIHYWVCNEVSEYVMNLKKTVAIVWPSVFSWTSEQGLRSKAFSEISTQMIRILLLNISYNFLWYGEICDCWFKNTLPTAQHI